jgi:acetyl-CoA acyltransferase
MKEAVIVSGARTAVGKAPAGKLTSYRPEDMGATVVKEALKRAPGLDAKEIEDVIIGCATPESEQGYQMARVISQRAGLPYEVPGQTVNRFCSSGLQTIALASERIIAGFGEVFVAGGVESMSALSRGGGRLKPNPYLAEEYPAAYTAMGITAENVAKEYSVSREDQDAFGLRSHQKAIAAIESGRFKDEIVPLDVEVIELDAQGKRKRNAFKFDTDEGPRKDTSAEALARLRPVFKNGGTVTAGTSSQTSDGAAAVVVMERSRAESLGLKPLVRFVSFAVAGVPAEVMGIGPIAAIPKALKLAGLTLDDIDLFELNEAFAAQALAVIRTLEMDQEKINVNGGAIALGHPLGATGAKLTVQLINEMKRRKSKYGMVTMCVGGGMGAAGIFENLQI